MALHVPRSELDPLSPMPVLFDALIEEDETGCVFEKTRTLDDPGVREPRTTPKWPHHLPGELVIGLTGQAACVFLPDGSEVETYRSQQDAIFFPAT